ncbi:MAG: hypothetical protein WBL06_08740 [Pseudolysinimonas sp.]|uniref:hypothetical protein n=1 Tax=Pseudolysinimonas sp. TaxID=2680009 RepID=UPI003C772569
MSDERDDDFADFPDDYDWSNAPDLPDLTNLSEEEKVAAIEAFLDKLPPEFVKKQMLKSGMLDSTLDWLKKAAMSDDLEARRLARESIEERQLGPLLADETSDDDLRP